MYLIVGLPAAFPVTTPVFGSTVANVVLVLLQVPPASPLELSVMVELTHTEAGPLMVPAFAPALTVIGTLVNAWPQPVVTR